MKNLRRLKALKKLDLLHEPYNVVLANVFTRAEEEALRKLLPGVETIFPASADEYPQLRDFGSALPEAGTKHIQDAGLKKLYWHLEYDAYHALRFAESLPPTTPDRLAVLEAMQDVLKRWTAEIAELRGYAWEDPRILAEYGDHFGYMGLDSIFEYEAGIEADLRSLRASGAESDVYARYAEHKTR